MPDHDAEVLDAELVDVAEHLPAPAPRPTARPLVDRHTLLRPGAPIPTTADAPVYGEADFRISQATADLLDNARPANTGRTYDSAWGQFTAWCAEQGRVALPCTTATFVEYVGHLIRAGKSPSTVRVAMSAIRYHHADGQEPGTKEAGAALRKHARAWARSRAPKKAPPITPDMLRAMVDTCDRASTEAERVKGLRDAALLTLGWGMLSRRSELAHLLIQQVAVEDDGVTVHVAFSKTDQEAKGEATFVPAVPDEPEVCPVRRLCAWKEEMRRHGHTSGPLFRAITRGGTITTRTGPDGDLLPLTPDAIGAIVKARAKAAGVPDPSRITAHGLRRGPAQYLAQRHQDPTAQGRWKQGSRTVERHYLAPARGRDKNPFTAARRQADG